MLNLKLFRENMTIGGYQEILVVKDNGTEIDERNVLYKGRFQYVPFKIENLEISYIRTNEDTPDTIIFEVKCNEG